MKSLLVLFLITVASAQQESSDVKWARATRQAQLQLRSYKFAEAVESANAALQIAKRIGPSRQSLPLSYALLGDIYRQWGRCSQSRANFSHAIEVWKKQPDPPAAPLFEAIFDLLSTLCECDDYHAAAKNFRTYETELQRLRSEPLDDAHLLGLRGTIARAAKHYRESEAYYRQEIDLLERTPGGTPVLAAEARDSLAVVLGQEGRQAESLAESEKVISLLESGVSYPALLAGALNNAACSLAKLGRKQDAQQTFDHAIRLAIETVGEDTRFTAHLMLNYARILRENKETPAAADMQKRGDAAYRRALLRDGSIVDVEDLSPSHAAFPQPSAH